MTRIVRKQPKVRTIRIKSAALAANTKPTTTERKRAIHRLLSKTHPESLYISTVLHTANHTIPFASGITREWFHAYRREWMFIERYIQKHQRVPSVELFRVKWPDVKLVKSDDIEYAFQELKDHHVKQGLIELLGDTADSIRDTKVSPVDLMRNVQVGLTTLNAQIEGTTNEADVVNDWKDTYLDVMRRQSRVAAGGQSGIITGFPTLDLATGGPQPGDYWIVAARLGMGKTWTLVAMACAALAAGHTVQYNALEQSRQQITMRIHTFLSAAYGKEIFKTMDLMQGKNFDLAKYQSFLKKLPELVNGKLVVNDTTRGRVTPLTIAAQIERNQPSIVLVDYLTLMSKVQGDWTAVAELSADMKGLATKYNIGMTCAAQLNRTGSDKRDPPGPETLSGADAIGQDADAVVTMVKRTEHVMMMRLAKFRHGRDGQRWFCEFRPNIGVYKEISGDKARSLMDKDQDAKDED